MDAKKDAEQYYHKGQSHINENCPKKAVVVFSRAILLNKNINQYRLGMAVGFGEQEKNQKACILYKRLISMDPSDITSCYNLAIILNVLGRTEESIEMYENVIRLDPGDAEAHENLAALLTMNGKSEEARKHYLKVLELRPSEAPRIANDLGCLYFVEGKFAKALEEFQKSINLKKKSPHPYCNTSLIYFCERKNKEALKYFEYGMETLEGNENKISIIKGLIGSYKKHRNRLEMEMNSKQLINEEKTTLFKDMIYGLAKMIDLLSTKAEAKSNKLAKKSLKSPEKNSEKKIPETNMKTKGKKNGKIAK